MFRTIRAVWKDLSSYIWPLTNRNNLIRAIILAGLIGGTFVYFSADNTEEAAESVNNTPVVFTTTAASVMQSGAGSFVGTVRALAEAQIQSEVGGRVTAVNVTPGETVAAGTVIATLENASQRAAVLQAEGSYEAAVAGAAQSDISVEDAQNAVTTARNNAVNAYRSAYTTANNIVFNNLDTFFSNPNEAIIGIRIDVSNAQTLNNQRRSLQTILPTWNQDSTTLTVNSDVNVALDIGITRTESVLALTDALLTGVNSADPRDTLNGQTVQSYGTSLNTARSALVNTITSLENSKVSLATANEALRKAQIGATGNTVSAADAQVKSALGTLRSAQAALAKTILRTPITGTVNSVSVNTGDFIGAFTQVAEIANNEALEISIFVGESDRTAFAVGDEVSINNTMVGTVTSIAPALDPQTLKTEIRIATESTALVNGATVTVRRDQQQSAVTTGPIMVPLTAVKFTATAGSMFFVEENVLVSRPVELGPVSGSNIEIVSGLSRADQFVIDARGLVTGTTVEARNNQ